LCEKSGAIALALPDLTAGRLADEIALNLKKILKLYNG